jgi:oligoendopeptidase F
MTPRPDAPKSDVQRLEKKIDQLAEGWNAKFEQIHQQFEKIGRLEERIAAYMGIAERIEQANQQDVKAITEKHADHEARLRSLEATLVAQTASQGLRNRITDSTVAKFIIPGFIGVFAYLLVAYLDARPSQVSVTTSPVINPPGNRQ